MNWFAKVWDRCFGPEEIPVPPVPPPALPPVIEAFLRMVADLDWRFSIFDYGSEIVEDKWDGRCDVTFSLSGEPTHYNLYKAEERQEFYLRLTTAISNEDLQLILEFLRQPPYEWMCDGDKESWDSCAGELLEIFVVQRADEVLPLLASELEYPGIRGTILCCFMGTPAATPYLLSWVEQLPELADEDAELLIDCLHDSLLEPMTEEKFYSVDKAFEQVRGQVNVSNPKIKAALEKIEGMLHKVGNKQQTPVELPRNGATNFST